MILTHARRTHLLTTLLVLSLLALNLQLATADRDKPWQAYHDCELETKRYFDGDSFYVTHPDGTTHIYRLIAVDTPETDTRYPDRIQAQADHFDISPKKVTYWGEKAKKLTEKLLRKPFSVYTQSTTAKGSSSQQRYYAIIITHDGQRLDHALIQAGLARVYGYGASWSESMPKHPEYRFPRKSTSREFYSKLQKLEKKAKRAKQGAW